MVAMQCVCVGVWDVGGTEWLGRHSGLGLQVEEVVALSLLKTTSKKQWHVLLKWKGYKLSHKPSYWSKPVSIGDGDQAQLSCGGCVMR